MALDKNTRSAPPAPQSPPAPKAAPKQPDLNAKLKAKTSQAKKGPAKELSTKQQKEKQALNHKHESHKHSKLDQLKNLRNGLLTIKNFLDKDGKVQVEKVRAAAPRLSPRLALQLQKKDPDILFLVFTKEEKATKTPGKMPKSFTFDSKGNSSINSKLGLVDFRRNDPSAQVIEVKSQNRGSITGHSNAPYGNFYSSYGSYVAIYTGDQINRKKDLSPTEAAKQKKLFETRLQNNTKLLKSILKPSQKEIIEEATRQGIDPKLIITLHSLGKTNPDFNLTNIDPSALRWQMTDISVASQTYINLSSKKPRDPKDLYNLGFLAFIAKRLNAPLDSVRASYRKLAGVKKLTGTKTDIANGERLATYSRRSRHSENMSLPIAISRDPKLEKIWNSIKKILEKNGINPQQIDADQAQDGLTLISYRDGIEKMLTGPKGDNNIKLIKTLIELGWKFNIRKLPQIDNFVNGKTDDKSLQNYRQNNLAAITGKPRPTLEKALDIISNTPSQHHILDCVPKNAGLSDYCWRGAINAPTAKTRAGWHSGIDLGGTWPVTAPTNCYLASVRPNAGSAGNYIKIRFKDRNGDTITFSMAHFGDTDSYQKILSRFRSGNRHIKKGELLAITGSTGNSTAPHLHLSVFRNGKRVDPFNWLPKNIQNRLIARRTDPANAHKYDVSRLRSKRRSWGLPNSHLRHAGHHHHGHSHHGHHHGHNH